jgi:hypothetical protein
MRRLGREKAYDEEEGELRVEQDEEIGLHQEKMKYKRSLVWTPQLTYQAIGSTLVLIIAGYFVWLSMFDQQIPVLTNVTAAFTAWTESGRNQFRASDFSVLVSERITPLGINVEPWVHSLVHREDYRPLRFAGHIADFSAPTAFNESKAVTLTILTKATVGDATRISLQVPLFRVERKKLRSGKAKSGPYVCETINRGVFDRKRRRCNTYHKLSSMCLQVSYNYTAAEWEEGFPELGCFSRYELVHGRQRRQSYFYEQSERASAFRTFTCTSTTLNDFIDCS